MMVILTANSLSYDWSDRCVEEANWISQLESYNYTDKIQLDWVRKTS